MVIPKYDIEIDPFNYESTLTDLILQLRPKTKIDNLEFRQFDGGLTNTVIGCYYENSNDVILCRIYGLGTEAFIDRMNEINAMILLHKLNIGSQVYCQFLNGICYEYIHGSIINYKLLQSECVYSKVACLIAQIHKLNTENNVTNEIFAIDKLFEYYTLMPKVYNKKTMKTNSISTLSLLPKPEVIKSEVQFLTGYLKDYCKTRNSKIVFSHNDILLANVIYDETLDKISFIDFEYSGYNYQAFDIGNHFNKYLDVNNNIVYPNKEYQIKWIKFYFVEYYSDNLELVTDEFIENFYAEVQKFRLLSHLLWGVWALVQAKNMNSDYDYASRSLCLLNEYFKLKDEFIHI